MMDRKQFVTRWGSAMQAIGATLAVLVVVGGWTLTRVEAWGDERYVLKGELKATVEALSKTLDERDTAAAKDDVEQRIVDLEDDIIWFSQNDNMPSALRRCRKLTRAVREWNNLAKPEKWESDVVVRGVCNQ